MSFSPAITMRKEAANQIEQTLQHELQNMKNESCAMTVSELARRCRVARSTVYAHESVFQLLKQYQKEQESIYAK